METLKTMMPEQVELLVMFESLYYDMDSDYRIAVDEAREVCAINYDYDTVYWGPRSDVQLHTVRKGAGVPQRS